MKAKDFTPEELEKHGILDKYELYDGPVQDATSVDFLAEAKTLANEVNKLPYSFTSAGAYAFLLWTFYQMGVCRGCEAYRAYLIDELKDECEADGITPRGLPEDLPFELNDGAVSGIVADLDKLDFADDLLQLFQLNVWVDDDDDGDGEK